MTSNESYSRPIPLLAIVLVALAVHGPLLLMQLPSGSFDANFHIFLASHYAHHWFNPWNEKWFAGLFADHISATDAPVDRARVQRGRPEDGLHVGAVSSGSACCQSACFVSPRSGWKSERPLTPH